MLNRSKLHWKNTPPNISNNKSCKSLPFYILGEAEKMVQDLVSSGVIRECTKPTQFCATSNFIRKPSGRRLRLITDLRPLKSFSERVGWSFWSASELERNILPNSKYSGPLTFYGDIIRYPSQKNLKNQPLFSHPGESTVTKDCPRVLTILVKHSGT